MPASIQIGRSDGGFTAGIVPAVQTTLVAATTELVAGIQTSIPVAGSTAVRLPMNSGGPVVLMNLAATAVTLLVFPPWNLATAAAAGGKISSSAVDASFSVAQNKSAVFYPHPNGIDFTAVLSA